MQSLLIFAAVLGLLGLLVVGVVVGVVRAALHTCGPEEILVLSGRRHMRPDGGGEVGYRLVTAGRVLRIPLVERLDTLSLAARPFEVQVRSAYSKGGIPLSVHLQGTFRISRSPLLVHHAIERFLGRDPGEVARVVRETLEGNLRAALATRSPEEVDVHRPSLVQAILEDAREDLDRLGLQIDAAQITAVSDDLGYLHAARRERPEGGPGDGA